MSILPAPVLTDALGSITVEVSNVRSARGRIHVDICRQDNFLKDTCPYSGEAPAHTGTVAVTVNNVPAGAFAAQVFHDENGNGDIDRGLFGIPKEGIGFSRNARVTLGPPSWRDAAFTHQARAEVIRLSLRYFMGPSGPPPAKR